MRQGQWGCRSLVKAGRAGEVDDADSHSPFGLWACHPSPASYRPTLTPESLPPPRTLDSWFSLEAPTLLPVSMLLPPLSLSRMQQAGLTVLRRPERAGDNPLLSPAEPGVPVPSPTTLAGRKLQLNLHRHFSESQAESFGNLLGRVIRDPKK